ncbi:MAG TPA: ABC transporter transmembrane domain-containing protein, partial [Candidatus Binatia bacterium]|nr:ABC transporter transmembrane domain-containing protein [Candidatus Binatia bacterium]
MSGDEGHSIHRRLAQQARPYWLHLTGVFLLSLLSSPFALLSPLPLKIAVASVLDHRPLPWLLETWLPHGLTQSPAGPLALAVGLLVGVAVLTQVRDFGNGLLTAYTGEKLLRSFRAQLFRHVQRLSFSYHDSKGTADSTYRIQYDAASVQNIVVEGVVPFITSAVTFLSMIYVTARINWQLAIVALAVSPAIFLVSRTYRHRMRRQSREVKKMESS